MGTDAYMAPEQCDAERLRRAGRATRRRLGARGDAAPRAFREQALPAREKDARDSEDPLDRFPQLHAEPEPFPRARSRRLRSLLIGRCSSRIPPTARAAGEVAAALEPLVAELPRKMAFSRRGSRVW